MVIKYSNKNDYCLVQKSIMFLYILLFKNNNYYFYEKIADKNYRKTYKIASKLLGCKDLKINEIKFNNYDILNKINKTLLKDENEEYYCLISETSGDNNYNTFCVYHNDKMIDNFKGEKNSSSFLVAYLDYKMTSIFFNNKIFIQNWQYHNYNNIEAKKLKKLLSEKEIAFYKRYIEYLFHLYKKIKFNDLYVDFSYISKINNFGNFFTKLYQYYDDHIGKYFQEIINKIRKKLNNDDHVISFYQYFKFYFIFLILYDYIKQKKIKNKTVILHSCIFLIDYVREDFLFNKIENNYIINHNILLKEKMLLFIDDNITKKEINRFINDSKKHRLRKMKMFL